MTRPSCPLRRPNASIARRRRLRAFLALAGIVVAVLECRASETRAAGTAVHEATDVPRRVPATGTAGAMETSVLAIPVDDEICGAEGATIRDVDVRLDLLHDFNADVTVWLTSPKGTTLPLFGRIGGGSTGMSVLLDDEAAEEIAGSVTDFTARRPEGALAGPGLCRFDGEKAVGDWKLDAHDWLGGSTGYLSSWALVLTCDAEGAASPCSAAEPAAPAGGEPVEEAAGERAPAAEAAGTASPAGEPAPVEKAADEPAPETAKTGDAGKESRP